MGLDQGCQALVGSSALILSVMGATVGLVSELCVHKLGTGCG